MLLVLHQVDICIDMNAANRSGLEAHRDQLQVAYGQPLALT